tara:strand:+ start:869 stop:1093 length:225 start_codon:yes stop_codon:yes gene_type:complete
LLINKNLFLGKEGRYAFFAYNRTLASPKSWHVSRLRHLHILPVLAWEETQAAPLAFIDEFFECDDRKEKEKERQ